MITLKAQGTKLSNIINDFNQEYKISKQGLYKDWNNREKWAAEVVQIDDPVLISELVQGLKQIIPNAWYEYTQGDNTSAKIGALKLVKDTYLNIIEILQSLGKVRRMPMEIEVLAPWLNKFTSQETTTNPTADS